VLAALGTGIRGGIQTMALPAAMSFIPECMRTARSATAAYPMRPAAAIVALVRGSRQDIYNILWAVVFGFATLNILSLAARRVEPGRRGLTFGELLAVMVVLLSVFLLGWEMLNLFHIFPIRLRSGFLFFVFHR
jgi:hypothetical protein